MPRASDPLASTAVSSTADVVLYLGAAASYVALSIHNRWLLNWIVGPLWLVAWVWGLPALWTWRKRRALARRESECPRTR